jgi:tRNA uridine 5-carboxymethylaminomethyl modification enzyme
MKFEYDVIVIGAGHAGCEAATAAAKMGADVLLITMDMNRVAQMSCNPAVGGIAKGQIVREIDALGGNMGIVADVTAIQFRMLNRSKGPAVWSPRVQSDRTAFIDEWRRILDATDGLNIFQDTVTELIFDTDSDDKPSVKGVKTMLGFEFKAKAVVLTTGTFLNGLMHIGETQFEGGRIAEPASYKLTEQLKSMGFTVGRMKTGTPVRIDGRSVDFSLCEPQSGDDEVSFTDDGEMSVKRDFHKFSFMPNVKRRLAPRDCYIFHTNPTVHKILHDNLDRSPLYNGQIRSVGPRYCPSIETKIVTFSDKESHQLFLEPEGETTQEFYLNGFSSSLPWEVQIAALEQIPALRNVALYRPGYAIEYDYFEPTQLTHDLQTKLVSGLYFAGQINGTTGYEEAAGQGLMAGINAARQVKTLPPIVLKRDEAYIGVLIDDLVTKGVDEPYRMFTSRAEYRILLRQDDADLRLTPIGYEIGLATKERYDYLQTKIQQKDELIEWCRTHKVKLLEENNEKLRSLSTSPISASISYYDLLKRPGIDFCNLSALFSQLKVRLEKVEEVRREEIIEAAEILIKYEGYISRERELAEKNRRLEYVALGDKIDYTTVSSLSTEARQKLTAIKPATIGQASRIPGVSPADISILLLLLKR